MIITQEKIEHLLQVNNERNWSQIFIRVFKFLLTLPVLPIKIILMLLIAPASWIYINTTKEEKKILNSVRNQIKTVPITVKLASKYYEVAFIDHQKSSYLYKQNYQESLIIYVGGNSEESIKSLMRYNLNDSANYMLHELKPYATSSQTLIDSVKNMIKDAIVLGYKPENIHFRSFSLGGALTMKALEQLIDEGALKEGQKFGSYHSYGSFSSIGKVKSPRFSFVASILDGILYLCGCSLSVSRESVEKVSKIIQDKQMILGWNINDNLISQEASIAMMISKEGNDGQITADNNQTQTTEWKDLTSDNIRVRKDSDAQNRHLFLPEDFWQIQSNTSIRR